MRDALSLAFVVVAVACSTDPGSADESRLEIWVGGRASVEPGLGLPMSGWNFTLLAPADRSFQSLACAASIHEPGVDWMTGGAVDGRIESWFVVGEPDRPRVRGHVLVVRDPMKSGRRGVDGMPPALLGDLYGSTDIIDVPPCYPSRPSAGCYAGGFLGEDVVIDSVFDGCQ